MSHHSSSVSVCQEAVAILREEQILDSEAVTTGVKHVVVDGVSIERQANKAERACYRAYERVRRHVISAFQWSFLRYETKATSTYVDGAYRTSYPHSADVKILGCYDSTGARVSWCVYHNQYIKSDYPIARIVYMNDEEDVDEWPTMLRDALVYSVAASIAIELTGRAADAQMCEKKSSALIQQSRTDDARQSGTGTSAYGSNYLFDVATGRRPAKHLGGVR